ncbi:MAG TPA: recombinase family protein [Stellaceae bacterium]|jgi:DNA invertase Pin-like site-specific DNA recombinase
MTTKAFAYLRTSTATNAGADKDSDKRQRSAILGFAQANKFEVVGEFYDVDVRGADPIHTRPAFAEMLQAILGNGVRHVLVESASRFSRDLIVQETGHQYLKDLGISLIAVDSPDSFVDETPTAVMIRQILGSISQFQKAELVAKLAGARARKRRNDPNYREGRKPAPVEAQRLARRLRRQGKSLREIGTALAQKGFTVPGKNGQPSGKPYQAQSVKVMLGG